MPRTVTSEPTGERPTVQPTRFDAFVVPEIPVLLRVATTLTGNSHDAEDLLQDTLVRAYRFLDSFDGTHPRAWLLTILRNTNANRNRRRRPGLFPDGNISDSALSMATTPSAEDLVTEPVLDAALEVALTRLSPKHAQVVALVDIAGLTQDEAALALDLPIGTVMSRLHRARRRLREDLRHHTDAGSDRS